MTRGKAEEWGMGWEGIRTWERCGKCKRKVDVRRVLPHLDPAHKVLRLPSETRNKHFKGEYYNLSVTAFSNLP